MEMIEDSENVRAVGYVFMNFYVLESNGEEGVILL